MRATNRKSSPMTGVPHAIHSIRTIPKGCRRKREIEIEIEKNEREKEKNERE